MFKKLFFTLLMFFSINTAYSQLEAARYSIKNLKVNSPYTDISPSLWGKNRVIFASSKNSKALVTKKVTSFKGKKLF